MMKKFLLLVFCFLPLALLAQNRFSKDAMLRKIYNFQYERQSDSLLPFCANPNPKYRYEAYLSFATVHDTLYAKRLIAFLKKETVDSLKSAIVCSLGQMKCVAAAEALLSMIETEKKQSVRNTFLEAIGKISYSDLTDFYIQKFNQNTSPNKAFVRFWARGVYFAKRNKKIDVHAHEDQILKIMDLILEKNWGDAAEMNFYYSKIADPMQEDVEKADARREIATLTEIENELKALKNVYEQVDFIKNVNLSQKACEEILASNLPMILKYQALDFYLVVHTWNRTLEKKMIQDIFNTGDVSLMSRMSEYIVKQNEKKKTVDITANELKAVQNQLKLPRDFETWIDLEKAILSYEGKKYQYNSCFENAYKNPMDWEYVMKIPENQKVKLLSNKGTMILQLKVNEAPGSVANFLKFVEAGFYNHKFFHRMVPNFVVQGGCPRGDGWGSLDWNQRSEFSNNLRYKKGSVGLASVGKDSEGVQFFITHGFTPNLDGRYSIFAEVVEGLDVIDKLVVGDEIVEIVKVN